MATQLPLSKDERLKFVNAILKERKANPNLGWSALFRAARKVLKPNRMSEGIDHPNKLPWIKPMLGIIEVQKNRSTRNGEIKVFLTDEDKIKFTQAVFELKKSNPQASAKYLIQEANKILPAEKHFNSQMDSFSKISWIKPMLDQLANPSKISKKIGTPILSKEEQLAFAKAFFEFKKSNPQAPNLHAIRHANNLLPDGRKIGKNIDSVQQIKWIIPLLEKLENPPKVASRWECKLTDKEKEEFASIVYRLRKGGATWTHCMREANTFMPEGHKIAASVINPSGVPWLQRALVKLEEADTSKVRIDHRGTLPKAEDPQPQFKKERKHSETKTYWNEEDKKFFAEVTFQLKLANPGWGWPRILEEANQEMPAHKRRPKMPQSRAQIAWLNPLLDEIARRPAPKHEPEPVKIPEIATPAPAPQMDMQTMMMAVYEKILREQMAMGAVPTIPTAMNNTPQKAEQPRRKKVIVVGLLEIQTQNIQKRFGHKFDFKFMGSNTPSHHIKACIKHGDICILMTRFVSHSTKSAMEGHPGYMPCNGNSTALENLLEEKFAKLDGQ